MNGMELLEAIKILDPTIEIILLTADKLREMRYNRWVISSDAFERCFGCVAHKGMREALEETYRWYLKMGQIPVTNWCSKSHKFVGK